MATATTFRNAEAGVTVVLVTETCAGCGVVFGMTKDFNQHRRGDGQTFYCPAGHQNYYGKSKAEKEADAAREELRKVEMRLKSWEEYANETQDKLTTERKSHAATKGQLTRTRNRIQSGHCPECHQFFGQLKRHMEAEHPREERDGRN